MLVMFSWKLYHKCYNDYLSVCAMWCSKNALLTHLKHTKLKKCTCYHRKFNSGK